MAAGLGQVGDPRTQREDSLLLRFGMQSGFCCITYVHPEMVWIRFFFVVVVVVVVEIVIEGFCLLFSITITITTTASLITK
jgi:hypothetical protein